MFLYCNKKASMLVFRYYAMSSLSKITSSKELLRLNYEYLVAGFIKQSTKLDFKKQIYSTPILSQAMKDAMFKLITKRLKELIYAYNG